MIDGVLICSTDRNFDDDISRDCSRCGALIFLRPYSDKVQTKVCHECGDFLMRESNGNFVFEILPETVRQIRRVLQLGGVFREKAK